LIIGYWIFKKQITNCPLKTPTRVNPPRAEKLGKKIFITKSRKAENTKYTMSFFVFFKFRAFVIDFL